MIRCTRAAMLASTLVAILLTVSLSGCRTDVDVTTPATTTPTTTKFTTTTQPEPPVPTPEPTTTQLIPTTTEPPFVTVTPTPPPATTTEPTVTPPPPPTTTQDIYSRLYHSYLLEGYPEDIWPLYESLAVDSCTLDIQTPAYNNMGEHSNNYSVIYITDKEQAEIAEFYNSLLDEPTEPGGFYDAKGTIGGYEVGARWSDFSYHYSVYLYVSLPNSPPAVDNPFFDQWPVNNNPFLSDFPQDIFPLYELDLIWAETFTVNSNPPSGQIFATKMFAHSGTKAGALTFYRELLEGAEKYEERTTEEWEGESYRLTGSLQGHQFSVTVGVWGREDMISITILEYLE